MCFIHHKSDAAKAFRRFLADNGESIFPSDRDLIEVEIVRSLTIAGSSSKELLVYSVERATLPKNSPQRAAHSSTASPNDR